MSAVKGRKVRGSAGEPVVLLQGRVIPAARDAAREAADELGISIAAYLEALVLADAEQRMVRPQAPYVQEVLPVSA
ncbi:hypothetical protein [Litorihabitans aurantiacus]|nr:hypothetical protein [Litorihabitans aurantiacus]